MGLGKNGTRGGIVGVAQFRVTEIREDSGRELKQQVYSQPTKNNNQMVITPGESTQRWTPSQRRDTRCCSEHQRVENQDLQAMALWQNSRGWALLLHLAFVCACEEGRAPISHLPSLYFKRPGKASDINLKDCCRTSILSYILSHQTSYLISLDFL